MHFWCCNGYPWNVDSIIDELTNESGILLLPKTWKCDIQRIQDLHKYNIRSLIWEKSPRKQRGKAGWHV